MSATRVGGVYLGWMIETRVLRIGFVATRFAGTDGVSLEAEKWAEVLREMGHDVYYLGGIVDRPPDRSRTVPEAFFGHPDIASINAAVFDDAAPSGRPRAVSRRIDEITVHLLEQLHAFVREYELDMLVPENALAIPIHLPLGLAITRLAAETDMPILAHHHDLPWERQRFLVSSAADIVASAFPPSLPNVRHVCINSGQREQIARRLGRTARVIPNVMDFQRPPSEPRWQSSPTALRPWICSGRALRAPAGSSHPTQGHRTRGGAPREAGPTSPAGHHTRKW